MWVGGGLSKMVSSLTWNNSRCCAFKASRFLTFVKNTNVRNILGWMVLYSSWISLY